MPRSTTRTWETHPAGSILIGAAALAPADLRSLAVVEAYDLESRPFDVTLALTVTVDFHRERRIHVPRERIDLRRR